MKKLISLMLLAAMVLGAAAATAEPKEIDGLTPREIRINPAGLNPAPEEMIAQGIRQDAEQHCLS